MRWEYVFACVRQELVSLLTSTGDAKICC